MLGLCLLMLDSDDDRKKFSEIYYGYHDIFISIAMQILNDFHDAEEAVQNAFSSIAKNINKINTDNDDIKEAYLFRTIKHTCYNMSDKSSRMPEIISLDSIIEPVSDDDIEGALCSKETFLALVGIIKSMPDIYRDVLVLSLLLKLSVTEIADLLAIPKPTVRTRIRRGLLILTKAIREAGLYE